MKIQVEINVTNHQLRTLAVAHGLGHGMVTPTAVEQLASTLWYKYIDEIMTGKIDHR